MEELLHDEDITSVLEMKKDFDKVLGSRRENRFSFSGRMTDNSSFGNAQSVSMQQFMEKERKEKERHAELVEVKALATKLKSELTSLQAKHQQTCALHDQKVTELNRLRNTDCQTASALKEQLRKLLTKDEELQARLNEKRAELTRNTTDYEQKLLTLQKNKYKLEMAIQEVEQQAHSRQQELRNNNLRKDSELNICQLELRETKEQLQHALKRCSTTSSQLQDADEARHRALKAEQRVKDLEKQLSEQEGERAITRSMKDQLDRLSGLESENRKLKNENDYCKETQDNVFLLREELDSMKKKLERADERCINFSRLQFENKDLKERLEKWETLKDGNTKRALSPKELSRRVSDLQHSNTSLLERQGLLQSSSHSLEEALRNKEHQLDVTQAKLMREQTQHKEAEQLIMRLKRKLLLVSKERDGYKNILESYESEVPAAPRQKSAHHQLQDTLQGYQRHITSLETELEQKAQELAQTIALSKEVETELHRLKQKRPASSAEADNKVLTQLRDQVATAEKRLEEIQVEKDDLQLRLDRAHVQGVYEPENTKVITMTMNPFSMARKRRWEEIETILEDNKRLKMRVQLIEDNQGELDDITQQVSQQLQKSGVDSEQIKVFEEQIRSAELKNKRLMEVFKRKSHELREVFYRLLGYMIQIPCDNQYRLLNMYANSPDEFLLFQQSEAGDLQLLETEYSATLTDKMELYLENGHSIPAFLSSVTMDLFNGQTMLE